MKKIVGIICLLAIGFGLGCLAERQGLLERAFQPQSAYAQGQSDIGSDRESLYRAMSPKLMEALCELLLDEFNTLRAEHGLAPRTKQQLAAALAAKYNALPDYDWQQNDGI